MSAEVDKGPVTFTISMNISKASGVTSIEKNLVGGSKVPGGPGALGDNLKFNRIYKLNSSPKIVLATIGEPDANGNAEINLELIIHSKVPTTDRYSEHQKFIMRIFELQDHPVDISPDTSIVIMAQPCLSDSDTRIWMKFKIKLT